MGRLCTVSERLLQLTDLELMKAGLRCGSWRQHMFQSLLLQWGVLWRWRAVLIEALATGSLSLKSAEMFLTPKTVMHRQAGSAM